MLLGNIRVFMILNGFCLEVVIFWDGKVFVKVVFLFDRKFSNWIIDKKLKIEII